jgi:hypothetical protein
MKAMRCRGVEGVGQAYSKKEARIQQELSGETIISVGQDSRLAKADLDQNAFLKKVRRLIIR